ncbi:MAG: hypothetical protein JAY74_13450 [Candidatus Thiodiazotropha taylori]|nr:hypothetical protein [Candidatus Thiodiazotropha taylori]
MPYLVVLLAGALAWERFIDEPEQVIIHEHGPGWKEYAVIGLAAAGGFYLASRVVK